RHTRWPRDWSSDVCSSDLTVPIQVLPPAILQPYGTLSRRRAPDERASQFWRAESAEDRFANGRRESACACKSGQGLSGSESPERHRGLSRESDCPCHTA